MGLLSASDRFNAKILLEFQPENPTRKPTLHPVVKEQCHFYRSEICFKLYFMTCRIPYKMKNFVLLTTPLDELDYQKFLQEGIAVCFRLIFYERKYINSENDFATNNKSQIQMFTVCN